MNTIEILTTIHIGTGNEIEAICYYALNNNYINRYELLDIMYHIPSDVLTNPYFLNSMNKNANKNNYKKIDLFQTITKYVNYNSIKPSYCLEYKTINRNNKIIDRGVSEQINDLHKPYIPGSSLKGAIFTAWKYKLIKDNYSRVLDNFYDLVDNNKFKFNFCELFFGNKNDEFLKSLYGCLLCDDFYFDELELFKANRHGSGKDMNGNPIPLPYKECIKVGQKSRATFLKIDCFKFEQLKKKYSTGMYGMLIHSFNEKNLLEACNEFTKDIIECEKTDVYLNFYEGFKGINEQISMINKCLCDKNSVVIRIGNSTNYFNKSISYLFKKNSPKLFADNPRVFMPTSKSKPYSIPKTRVIYANQSFDYLPGFIKVTYD
mgnify:FL=1